MFPAKASKITYAYDVSTHRLLFHLQLFGNRRHSRGWPALPKWLHELQWKWRVWKHFMHVLQPESNSLWILATLLQIHSYSRRFSHLGFWFLCCSMSCVIPISLLISPSIIIDCNIYLGSVWSQMSSFAPGMNLMRSHICIDLEISQSVQKQSCLNEEQPYQRIP